MDDLTFTLKVAATSVATDLRRHGDTEALKGLIESLKLKGPELSQSTLLLLEALD